MNRKANGLCNSCPRGLKRLPQEPCPLALQRVEAVHAVQSGSEKKKELDELPGCPWFTMSSEHNYCFWAQVSTHDPAGRIDPMDDKEIMASLGMTQSQVDRTASLAMAKLKAQKDSPEFQEMREHLADMDDREIDNSVYLPDNFIQQATPDDTIIETDSVGEPDEAKPKKKKKKTQLYGLYSQKKLNEIKNEAASKASKKK